MSPFKLVYHLRQPNLLYTCLFPKWFPYCTLRLNFYLFTFHRTGVYGHIKRRCLITQYESLSVNFAYITFCDIISQQKTRCAYQRFVFLFKQSQYHSSAVIRMLKLKRKAFNVKGIPFKIHFLHRLQYHKPHHN